MALASGFTPNMPGTGVFPENVGSYLSIDETALSRGELYTILSNKEVHGGKGTIVVIVKDTRIEDIVNVLRKLPCEMRLNVKEVTMDLSDSMHDAIVETLSPKAMITLDRFHVQQLCSDEDSLRSYHSLRMIFSNKEATKESAAQSMKKWYNKVTDFDNDVFNTFSATICQRKDEILNYFVNRSTNASVESLNARIKHFRAQLRGAIDVNFLLYRFLSTHETNTGFY